MTEKLWKHILLICGASFLVFFCLGPFLYMGLTSFSRDPSFLSETARFEFSLKHYRDVLWDPSLHFMHYLANSLIISGVSALLSIGIASCAAYAITKMKIKGKNGLLMFVLAVSLFPQISLISYLFKMMTSLGWINTYGALILPYVAWILPLTIWILVSYFAQLPDDLDNAALVDGCSRWQSLTQVMMPIAAPGIFSAALLSFIFAFNEFLFALMLTSDYHARTVPVGIALFQGTHGQIPWGNIMAASMITTLPVIILAVAFQQRIVQGLTQGAVKE